MRHHFLSLTIGSSLFLGAFCAAHADSPTGAAALLFPGQPQAASAPTPPSVPAAQHATLLANYSVTRHESTPALVAISTTKPVASLAPQTPPLPSPIAAPLPPPPDPLDQVVPFFRPRDQSIHDEILAVAATYGINLVPQEELSGKATFQLTNATVRQVLNALTIPYGYYWSLEDGIYYIRHFQTKFYHINYPRIQRTSSSSSSISLAPSTGNSTGSNGASGSSQMSSANSAGSGSTGSSGSSDNTTGSVSNTVSGDIWDGLEAQVKTLLATGETVNINRFSGIVTVTASPYHQVNVAAFLKDLNQRVNRRVKIEARIIEVQLTDQQKLGIDWSLANSTLNGALNVSASTATNISSAGSAIFNPNTVTGNLAIGKVAAVISALAQQGNVHSVSNPELETLNNQPATIKVGTQQSFFSLSSTYSLNQTTATTPTSSTQNVYQQNTVTFGTVMEVTPSVNDDGSVTLSILPAITRLAGITTSPDGSQQAPETDVKTVTTIVNLMPGSAAMVGGLIFASTASQKNSVPLLGSIPIIGKAFQTNGTIKERDELVIFLTATPL